MNTVSEKMDDRMSSVPSDRETLKTRLKVTWMAEITGISPST
jgi:hypothetical protein